MTAWLTKAKTGLLKNEIIEERAQFPLVESKPTCCFWQVRKNRRGGSAAHLISHGTEVSTLMDSSPRQNGAALLSSARFRLHHLKSTHRPRTHSVGHRDIRRNIPTGRGFPKRPMAWSSSRESRIPPSGCLGSASACDSRGRISQSTLGALAKDNNLIHVSTAMVTNFGF